MEVLNHCPFHVLLDLVNGLRLGEGTNSVGIVRLDLGFCLGAVSASYNLKS